MLLFFNEVFFEQYPLLARRCKENTKLEDNPEASGVILQLIVEPKMSSMFIWYNTLFSGILFSLFMGGSSFS